MINGFYKNNRVYCGIVAVILSSLSACTSVDKALDTTTGVNYSHNKSVAVLQSPKGIVPPEYDMTYALPESNTNTSATKSTVVDIRPPDLVK